jgi:two-component system sensor histidine kinase LytS
MEQKDYSKLIPFMEELDYIETYLKLEAIRFEGKLHVEYDIQETKFWVLPLTLQPFVENAVKHGVLPLKQGGTLWISSRKTKSGVEVEIKDNGVGFDTRKFWSELDNTKSVGMKSAIYRLESEMGAACKIKSSQKSGESGTCILIQIPERK